MTRPDRSTPADDTWHASPALVTAYAGGRAGPVDAASLEIHLTACSLCRSELALSLSEADRLLLEDVRPRVGTAARPTSSPRLASRVPTAASWTRLVLRPDALVAVVLAVALAFVLDLSSRLGAAEPGLATAGGGLLRVLAPAIPLAGVALCSVRGSDPCREAVLASPSAGLRLTLWRTLVVLSLALPATLVLELLLAERPGPATWLLPGLALSATTLALGTVLDLTRAAAGVGVLWCVAVLGPTVANAPGGAVRALADLATGASSTVLLATGPVQLGWLALLVVAGVVIGLRRSHYAWLDGGVVAGAA